MKSIFKKIAFVLALAMVVTMLPARSAAAAAKGPQMKAHRVLYLNEGGDVTGTYLNKAYATVWNFREDGYTVKFESKNPGIAIVGAKKGMVTAISVGVTEIIATFSKEGAADVVKTCKVEVKKNAAAVTIDEDSQLKLGELKVGEKFTAVAVKTDADGSNEDITDGVRFAVADEKIATVDKKTGEITAVAAGETELTVWGVQWEYSMTEKKYVLTNTTTETPYKLVVVAADPTVINATVKSVTKIELVVAGVTDENIKDLKITNENDVPQNLSFKLDEAKLNDEKTLLTVEHRTGLKNGDVLKFSFGKEDPYVLNVKIGEIRQIVLNGPVTVPADNYDGTKLEIQALDEYGVDLGIAASNLSFAEANNSQNYQIAEDKIIVYGEIGTKVTLTATYTSGKLNDKNEWETITINSNPLTIQVVKAADVTVKEITWKIGDDAFATNSITAYVAENPTLDVQVVLSNSDDKIANPDVNISYETLDPAVVLVDSATGYLTPLKAGTTGILVKYDNGEGTRLSVVAPITVKAEKKLSRVIPDQATTIISNATGIETKKINFTGKDQYDLKWDATAISKVEILAAPTKDKDGKLVDSLGWVGTNSGTTLMVTGNNQPVGTYTYRVSVADNVSTVISVVVKSPKVGSTVDKAASYKIVVLDNENVEVKSADVIDTAKYTFKIVALDASGVAFANVMNTSVKDLVVKVGGTAVDSAKVVSDDTGKYTVDLVKSTIAGVTVPTGSAVTGSAIVIDKDTNVVAENGTQYQVLEGNVTITAKVTAAGKNDRLVQQFASGNVAIKKEVPKVEVKNTLITSIVGQENVENAIIAELKASNGNNVYDILSIGARNSKLEKAGTSIVFVETVRVAERRSDGSTVVHTIHLNKSFQVTVTEY